MLVTVITALRKRVGRKIQNGGEALKVDTNLNPCQLKRPAEGLQESEGAIYRCTNILCVLLRLRYVRMNASMWEIEAVIIRSMIESVNIVTTPPQTRQ